jgi:hypothetical protein
MSFIDSSEMEDAPVVVPGPVVPGLSGYIKQKFIAAEEGRRSDEARWLSAYKNYRGLSEESETYRESERSKVTVKITKVKVLAAYGQISEILFGRGDFPLVIEPTPDPEGIEESVHLNVVEKQMGGGDQSLDPYGFEGDGRELAPGSVEASAPKLGGLTKELEGASLKKGYSKLGEPDLKPADIAARRLNKILQDQLIDTSATKEIRRSLFEQALLGTGVVKGPFNFYKKVHKWEKGEDGERIYSPYEKTVPRLGHVSCWNFYPDPSAVDNDDCEYVIERHRLNREQLRNLKDIPLFDLAAINRVLSMNGTYEERYFENTIYSDQDPTYNENRYEVLEYWGTLDATSARAYGLELPYDMDEISSVQINAWICGTEVLRVVLNPFTPARIPYQIFPYEKNPYQVFGVGVAENMEDAQLLMNGHMRMAIDNLALAGNLVFDVDEASLVPGQNFDIYPGKVFRRQSGVTGTAINGLKFPSTAGENMQMYDKARQLADEETGIPSITHGQTGVTGTGRTASGLSMLLGSAGLNVKTVIKNIDDYLLRPLGEAFFQWNMQFNEKAETFDGDLEIKPRGTVSVMMKEVRSQRLTMLLQTVSNPMLAPFMKIQNLIKELAISQDMDPRELVNDPDEAAVYAEILRSLNVNQQGPSPEGQAVGQQPGGMGGDGAVPASAGPMDATGAGNGTVGTGIAPGPGEAGFAATNASAQEVG